MAKKAVVKVPRCPLYLSPEPGSPLADEALLGWTVEVLEERGDRAWVETDYRYRGWAPVDGLERDPRRAAAWADSPRETVLQGVCDVLEGPRYQSATLLTALRGCQVAPREGAGDQWRRVALPDGREGFLRGEALEKGPGMPLREGVCRAALAYFGTPYRWGGKSPLGIDCSGLAFMAYRLRGVTIYRDAALRAGFPMAEVPRERMAPGDLLFFPGHVAVYLGEGRYIHATGRRGSAGVVINSLDPTHPAYRADLAEGLAAVGSLDKGAAAG